MSEIRIDHDEDDLPNDEGMVECPACEGTGTIGEGTSEATCALCDGDGYVLEAIAIEYEAGH